MQYAVAKILKKNYFRYTNAVNKRTAYVARTDRSRFYCRILCPRVRPTLCKNMVTFYPAGNELEVKMYKVTLTPIQVKVKGQGHRFVVSETRHDEP